MRGLGCGQTVIIQGHPDSSPERFCRALAAAYADGAARAGHEVRTIDVAALHFPVVQSRAEWERGEVPPAIKSAQEAFLWAEHLVMIYPLWLGGMPALLKAFLEQLLRPDFAFKDGLTLTKKGKPLAGRSVRIVVTMGMPIFFYRWYFGAHSLKSLERNILKFAGMGPVRENLIGMIESKGRAREKWLEKVRALGRDGA